MYRIQQDSHCRITSNSPIRYDFDSHCLTSENLRMYHTHDKNHQNPSTRLLLPFLIQQEMFIFTGPSTRVAQPTPLQLPTIRTSAYI